MDNNIMNLEVEDRKKIVDKLMTDHKGCIPVVFRFGDGLSFSRNISNPRMFLPQKQTVLDVVKNLRR